MWCAHTKQGISHTGLFQDTGDWSCHGENDPSVDFEISIFLCIVFYLLLVILTDFQTFSHKNPAYSVFDFWLRCFENFREL